MAQQHRTQQNNKEDNKAFNDALKSLGVVLSKLYKDHASLIVLLAFIILFCVFILIRTVDISYLYSIFVTSLFIFLSIGSYVKEKSSLISITSFSLGIFTAFTVTWNGSTFSIFFVSFIILVVSIFLIAAVRLAATKEELLTRAASFYVSDSETNKEILKGIDKAINKQQGILPLSKRYEAILFFAFHKVPKDRMIALMENVNQIYAITKIESERLLTLFKNIHVLSRTENEFQVNKKVLEIALFKGEIIPQDLIDILNSTLYIAIENDIKFGLFVDAILVCSSHGYSREGTIERLTEKFIRKNP